MIQSDDAKSSPSSWIKQIPISVRKKKAAASIGIGGVLSIVLWVSQVVNHVPWQNYWFGAVPVIIGLLIGRWFLANSEEWEYRTEKVLIPKLSRFINATFFTIIGLLSASAIYSGAEPDSPSVFGWIMIFVSCVLFLGVVIHIWRTTEKTELTREALREKQFRESNKKQSTKLLDWEEKLVAKLSPILTEPGFRYPLAVVFLWITYEATQAEKVELIYVLFPLGVAVWLAHELSLWLLGAGFVIGIGWALIAGASALPVSLAVIIGALIIAGAMKK